MFDCLRGHSVFGREDRRTCVVATHDLFIEVFPASGRQRRRLFVAAVLARTTRYIFHYHVFIPLGGRTTRYVFHYHVILIRAALTANSQRRRKHTSHAGQHPPKAQRVARVRRRVPHDLVSYDTTTGLALALGLFGFPPRPLAAPQPHTRLLAQFSVVKRFLTDAAVVVYNIRTNTAVNAPAHDLCGQFLHAPSLDIGVADLLCLCRFISFFL